MPPLDAHLEILREILSEKSPLSYLELSAEVLARAVKKHFATSPLLVARLTIGTISNLEPVRLAFPNVPKILVLLADGRYELRI